MKTNVLKATIVAVIALVGGSNMFKNLRTEPISDSVLANVEALADDIETNEKYRYVYYKEPGDPGYPETICVCSVKDRNGSPCC